MESLKILEELMRSLSSKRKASNSS